MTTTHTLSLGPLSLLAEQHGPLLTITIHAPSDTAPVGKMTLTVPEWTALVALVGCMGVGEKLKQENDNLREFIAASEECAKASDILAVHEDNERYRAAFQQLADRIQAGNHTVSNAFCSWCRETWPHLDGETAETAQEHARRHAFACKSHPLRIERDAAIADRDSLRHQVRELTEERDWLRARDENNGCAHLPWCDDMGMDNHDPSCPANAVTLQCEASQLRSDLSAALVAVDAMAKRLEQLQPIVSVLGDWDWQAIRDEGCWRDDEYIDAMRAVVKALAHTASEQGKESK